MSQLNADSRYTKLQRKKTMDIDEKYRSIFDKFITTRYIETTWYLLLLC